MKKRIKKKSSNSILVFFMVVILIVSSFALLYSIKSIFTLYGDHPIGKNFISGSQMNPKLSKMSFTSFDIQLAREFMDKDNDGKCDACGMPVEMCIDGSELECTMTGNAKIGKLGSQHIHADWKIYINGKTLDISDKAHMERMRSNLPVSSFIHVDSGAPAPEKIGDVLHMHATGVPLWIFFKSVGIEVQNNMKLYVNGKLDPEELNYVFKDLDKMLITDEAESTLIQQQLNSITDFSNTH